MATSRAASTRPRKQGYSNSSMTPPTRGGRCGRPVRCWTSVNCGPTAGIGAVPAAPSPIVTRAGHRCMRSWTRRLPRFWPSSMNGVRWIAPIANSHIGAPTWAGFGCHRQQCGGYFSLQTNTFDPFHVPGSRRNESSRRGPTTPRIPFGFTTPHIFPRAGMAVLIIEDCVAQMDHRDCVRGGNLHPGGVGVRGRLGTRRSAPGHRRPPR